MKKCDICTRTLKQILKDGDGFLKETYEYLCDDCARKFKRYKKVLKMLDFENQPEPKKRGIYDKQM